MEMRDKICTLGYLEGTFDLFHIGHLNFIEEAKKKCDFLIVGVYSDEVVYSYKGRFPIIPCLERACILNALKSVDSVIQLHERNKIKAYKKIHYNILFMSTFWRESPDYVHLEENLGALNVDVIWIPYYQGISTSTIINRIETNQNIRNKQKDSERITHA